MKHTKAISTTLILGMLALVNASAEAMRPRNLSDAFGDFHATAGYEIATPFFNAVDANADGYPESINVSIKVFTAGTTTLLRQTAAMSIPTPAIPAGCTAATAADWLSMEVTVRRREPELNSSARVAPDNKRMHLGINMDVDCPTSGNLTMSGAVYSADLSGTGASGSPGASWVKSWKGRLIEGLNGIDLDNDLVSDAVMITTGGPTSTGWNFQVVYARGSDGAINTTTTTSNGSTKTLPTSGKTYTVDP